MVGGAGATEMVEHRPANLKRPGNPLARILCVLLNSAPLRGSGGRRGLGGLLSECRLGCWAGCCVPVVGAPLVSRDVQVANLRVSASAFHVMLGGRRTGHQTPLLIMQLMEVVTGQLTKA
jgi:hypothetical protein